MEVVYVNTDKSLQQVCARFALANTLGIDTEFLREKTYYAQLCLIQICGNGLIACIDPLELDNIDAAMDLIYDPNILKIFHSGRQDLEVLFDLKKSLPENIFDTQLAATFLGQGEQLGYAAVVQDVLNVVLPKTQTRTDWSRRPLNERQLEYAADDVRYLQPVYDYQIKTLKSLGRFDWLSNDLGNLTDISLFEKPKHLLWQRVKAWQQLHGQSLTILQALAILRENIAMQSNRPRRWILSDQDLLSLAHAKPETETQLGQILVETTRSKYADSILTCIANARNIPAEQWPQAKGRHEFNQSQTKLIKQVMGFIRKIADIYGLTATLMATRKDIESLISDQKENKILQGWRYDTFGKIVLALVKEELSEVQAIERVKQNISLLRINNTASDSTAS